jgi:Na+-transporting NADH:ubiquinone oxidoreductase subunit NqrB
MKPETTKPFPNMRFFSDGRHFQIAFLAVFLLYGILWLGWYADLAKYAVIFGAGLAVQGGLAYWKKQGLGPLKSSLITCLSLSILLYAGSYWVYALAAALAVAGKYFLRYKGKHLFNPANFGIVAVLLLSGQAWISPGQWGNALVPAFFIAGMGAMVLLKVGRIDTGLAFLAVFLGCFFLHNIVWRQWPLDFFTHQAANGALWLFALFMITDPMTSPNHPKARIAWATSAALAAFYAAQFHFINGAPIWILFFWSPLSAVFDKIWKAEKFQWGGG